MTDGPSKTAVITGAASGIGRGLALKCATEGMALVLSDVDQTRLDVISEDAKSLGAETIAVLTDVSKAEEVEALANKAFDSFGQVDLLFNNAGVMATGNSWEQSLDEWRWILGVNYWGVLHGIHFFVPRLLEQERPARIINTASIAGFLNAPINGSYSVSKHAVIALSETLHYELEALQSKVRVSVLCPGPVATDIIDADRNRPSEIKRRESEEAEAFKNALREGLQQTGMTTERLAEIVFDHIENDKFWIFPHPQFKKAFHSHFDSVLSETNPIYSPIMDFDNDP